ncbi:MAG TPA: hypothetical protein VFU15_05465 [Bacteroidia bacterium]|nr:hypothetical protein [Bacteroidia bacterium]
MRIFLLTALLFLASFPQAAGQTVLHTAGDSSDVKSKVKVRVINPHGKKPIDYTGVAIHTDSVQMAIKINPLNALRGDFPAYFEWRVSDPFSVEVALGATYIDYMYELVNNGGQYILDANERRNVKFYSGFTGRFQLRWYPSNSETAITGFYIAPEFARRTYRMDYYVNTGLIREPHPIHRNYTDFRLQIGWQNADPYENVFLEWFASAGIRFQQTDWIEGSGTEAVFKSDSWASFVVGGGLKIGFTL